MEVDITDSGREYLSKLADNSDFTGEDTSKGFYLLLILERQGPEDLEELIVKMDKTFHRDHRQMARGLFEAGYIEQV